jgi:hypothetical protein
MKGRKMARIYCDVHGTPMFMQQHYMACTTNECDRISLDGKTCTSKAKAEAGKMIDAAISARKVKFSEGCVLGRRAVERLGDVLAGRSDNYTNLITAGLLKNQKQKIAFLRQTDSLLDFPEESLGSQYFPEDPIGKIEVNHLRFVHARSEECKFNSDNSFMQPHEKVVRIASKTHRKIFRWSGKLLESTIGLGVCFQESRLFDMKALHFHEWCRWHEHWWTGLRAPEDPMHDCDPDKEWRQKDLFILPIGSGDPLIIKAMGASALVAEEYCWFLNEPLASAEKHKSHMDAVIQANKWLLPNGILAGYAPRKKEQSHVTLLRNYLGGKNKAKSLLEMPKVRKFEF